MHNDSTDQSEARESVSRNLGNRVFDAAIWMTGAQILARFSGSIKIIALAAILPQHQLGLFGIALIVLQLIERLSETGMRQALIQSPGKVGPTEMGTAWVSQIFRGLLLALCLFFSADSAETFFEKPGVSLLLTWLAIVPLIQGFNNVGVIYLNRELRFRKIVLLGLASTIIDIIFAIGFTCCLLYTSPSPRDRG